MPRLQLAKCLSLLCLPILASTVHADPKPILGYLGQASRKLRIYASPSSQARVYWRVPAKQYLVIRPYTQAWDQVLLQTGIYGFVNRQGVKELPYEVSARTSGSRDSQLASRGFTRELGSMDNRGLLANYALKFVGRTPYVWGGNDVSNGIDCSGFVKQMYGAIGVDLPRTAAEQALVGQPIYRVEDLRKGDRLYFWDPKRGKIGHTGIYEGEGIFVHSSSGKRGVNTSYLTTSWRKILVAARR